MQNFGKLTTEGRNDSSVNIDRMSPLEIVTCINNEDKTVAYAVERCLDSVAAAVAALGRVLNGGGRIFYVGAGTSGRLGVLDASECPPTYGVPAEKVQGLIAGGKEAAFSSIENAEDNEEEFTPILTEKGLCDKDALVGISASGSAACVHGAMKLASKVGATVISVSCNADPPMAALADISITSVTGPEVISGSTRMKAGTATKMILNMLSTGAMVMYGRVRGNTMAYMNPSNHKLVDRAIRMVREATHASEDEARTALNACGNIVADAIDYINKTN